MQRVSPTEAHALMHDEAYAYLDVRTVAEFDAGHPAGAFNVPWALPSATGMTENARFVAEVSARWAHDAKLVLGCKACARSELAAQALSAAGFRTLVIQRAGMDGVRDAFGRTREPGWAACALPVEHAAAAGHSHAEIAARLGPVRDEP